MTRRCCSTDYANTLITRVFFQSVTQVASHAGVFRGARISSLPTNASSTENNIPFPSLANHIVPSKFWKADLDRRITRQIHDLHETLGKLSDL